MAIVLNIHWLEATIVSIMDDPASLSLRFTEACDDAVPAGNLLESCTTVRLDLPHRLALSDALLPLEGMVDAFCRLQTRVRAASFGDRLIRAESRFDALALGTPASSADDLLRLLVLEASEEQPGPRAMRQAANAVEALEHGLLLVHENGASALTLGLLQDMHDRLCAGLDEPAALDETGQSTLVADPMLRDLERFLAGSPALPLPVRVAIVVALVECAQPFGSANRQLAWLLPPMMMAAEGRLPLFLGQTLAAVLADYETALDTLRVRHDWEAWICFFLNRMTHAAEVAIDRLERLVSLQQARELELLPLRSDSTARRLAELVLGVPVLTVGTAQAMLGVSFQTANAAVATLQKLGIVTPYSSNRRNRVFIVEGTLAMLAGAGQA